jgi:hypothetical protein
VAGRLAEHAAIEALGRREIAPLLMAGRRRDQLGDGGVAPIAGCRRARCAGYVELRPIVRARRIAIVDPGMIPLPLRHGRRVSR